MVVGRTGAGKSATANLLVGCRTPVFETGDVSTSVTHVVREESFFYRGAKVSRLATLSSSKRHGKNFFFTLMLELIASSMRRLSDRIYKKCF